MKKSSFLLVLTGALFYSTTLYGQNKYTFKKNATSVKKVTYQYTPKTNNKENVAGAVSRSGIVLKEERLPQHITPTVLPNVSDLPVINGPVDVYSDSPILLSQV